MKIVYIPVSIDKYLPNAGSSRIRCEWMAKYTGGDVYNGQCLEEYDVIVYQKCCLHPVVRALADIYKHKIQVFDLCDPEYFFAPESIQYMVDRCQILTASNPSLAEDFARWAKRPVYCLPDSVDLDFFKIQKVHEDKKPTLVWFGYTDKFSIINEYRHDIEKLNLDLIAIGDYKTPYGIFHKWEESTIKENILKGDIVLNPVSIFKSNNKTLWAWALGLPVAENLNDIKKFLSYQERLTEVEWRLDEVKNKWSTDVIAKQFIKMLQEYKNENFKNVNS